MSRAMESMNRREFLGFAAGGAAAAMIPSVGCRSELTVGRGVRAKRPNIIFILADDLGYGDLGCYGQKKIETPNLDRMAAEGMRFTQHYSGSTVCAPARCVLMTGLHTGHCHVRGNYGSNGYELPLPADTITLPKILQKAGYRTACIGKWGLGGPGTTGAPNKQGFDYFFGYLGQVPAHFYYPDHLWRNTQKVPLDGKTYSHDLVAKEALAFVQRNKKNPFLLYLAYTIPHAELAVPPDSLNQYDGRFPEKPFEGGHYAAQEKPHATFAAMVSRMDRDIGRLFAKLRELQIDKDTVVFFSSDNGPHEEGGADPEFFKSSGPLRGIKRDLYEGGIRVPMIARWPGKIKPASVTDHISAFWDFMPTACEIAGVKSPKRIDGISYLPALLAKEQTQHDYLYWEFFRYNYEWKPGRTDIPRNYLDTQAVRMGSYKAVRPNVYEDPDASVQLYDLTKDIGENHNIADEHPQIVAKIEHYLETARTPSEYFPTPKKCRK